MSAESAEKKRPTEGKRSYRYTADEPDKGKGKESASESTSGRRPKGRRDVDLSDGV